MAPHITKGDREGFFKKCSMSSARIRWMLCCGMAVKRMGVFGVIVRKMETVTLIGKGG